MRLVKCVSVFGRVLSVYVCVSEWKKVMPKRWCRILNNNDHIHTTQSDGNSQNWLKIRILWKSNSLVPSRKILSFAFAFAFPEIISNHFIVNLCNCQSTRHLDYDLSHSLGDVSFLFSFSTLLFRSSNFLDDGVEKQ